LAAGYIGGATTQNITQTGDLLVSRQAHGIFLRLIGEALTAMADLAERGADMPIAGRTHGQHAVPATFGYKPAVWIDEMIRHVERLRQAAPRLFVAMLGGGAGTFASLGAQGPAVQAGIGKQLGMLPMRVPSRTIGDHLAENICLLGLLAATCGKIAREIYTLMKTEFGEVEEPVPPGTVGSSTMPQKRPSSANPVRPFADWLKESREYIQFVNPGDLRVAAQTCGNCHPAETRAVQTSMMTHGAMLWQAALYNNGAFPFKEARFGESYSPDGTPQRISTWPAPSEQDTREKGILSFLDPLARWELSQPGNLLRVFERGGGPRSEIGNPLPEEDPGRPDDKLSDRGLGTLLRTDPVFLGLQKTRLLDPLLSISGTNDHPGDYRNSGCTACHVIYANDRSPAHSGPYAIHGNQGRSAQIDPTIPKNESGHPIKHEFTRSVPTSQCIVCHIHPGTNMVASYLGYTWWDNETDGDLMYPKKQHNPTDEERYRSWQANPEAAAARGLWSDAAFLEKLGTPEFNQQLKNTQFADFHGHGWVFRAVYKRDRKGNLLDAEDRIVPDTDKDKFQKAVHLQDIHLEKGMHCSDCHFAQDNHGNGKIYGETRNAVEIDCVDCHGTIDRKATLRTSAAAAPAEGNDLSLLRTPFGQRRFYWQDQKLYQRSMIDKNRAPWEVVQVVDTITPGNPHYSEQSRLAKHC